jgi:diguanylate cyclase (GGDEF)-like protein
MPNSDLGCGVVAGLAIVVTLVAAIVVERTAPLGLAIACLYLVPIGVAGWQRAGIVTIAVTVVAAFASIPIASLSIEPAAIAAIGVRLAVFATAASVAWHVRTHLEGLTFCAYHDALTGLRNRRGLELAATVEIARARRYGRPLTIAYLDVDDFKAINDTRGHAVGDRALEIIAAGLRRVRECDVAARVGGDEFVVLMTETTELEAEAALERVRAEINAEANAIGLPLAFTCGMVRFEQPPESLVDMLGAVDRCLYDGKRTRKSSTRVATIDLSVSTMRLRRSTLTSVMSSGRRGALA